MAEIGGEGTQGDRLRGHRQGRGWNRAYIVTKRGRRAAVLLPIEDAEDAVLANADEYVRLRREAREEHRIGHTVSLGDLA